MKILIAIALAVMTAQGAAGGNKGGVTADMLATMRASQPDTPSERALRNALSRTDINPLAHNARNDGAVDILRREAGA